MHSQPDTDAMACKNEQADALTCERKQGATQAQPGMDGARSRAPSAPAETRLGLSKAHISPRERKEWTVKVWEGGALIELIGPGLQGQRNRGGGKRGKVGAFTPACRMRLMKKMARVRCDVLPQFITLTYADEFPTVPAIWKRDLDALLKRLRRLFPNAAGFWKLEMKERQSGKNAGKLAPHFHILLWNVPLAWDDSSNRQLHWRFALQSSDITNGKRLLKREVFDNGVSRNCDTWGQASSGRVEVRSRKKMIKRRGVMIERETVEWWEIDDVAHLDQALVRLRENGVGCGRVELGEWLSLSWYEIVRSDDPAHLKAGTGVEQVESSRGVMAYASKYIAKIEGTPPPVGRWWGMFNPQSLPWGKPVELDLSTGQAARLRRVARQYVKHQKRKEGRRPWRPRGSCAWFCRASDWLRLVREIWEPEDPFQVEGILRKLKPIRRISDNAEKPTVTDHDVAKTRQILAEAQTRWAEWRKAVSVGGFWHTD